MINSGKLSATMLKTLDDTDMDSVTKVTEIQKGANAPNNDSVKSDDNTNDNTNQSDLGTIPSIPLDMQSTLDHNRRVTDVQNGPNDSQSLNEKSFDIESAIAADHFQQEEIKRKKALMFAQIDMVLRNGMDTQQQKSSSLAIRTIISSFLG